MCPAVTQLNAVARRSFQHAVYRNVNEKNAQLQKQLDNVIREGGREFFSDMLQATRCSMVQQTGRSAY